MADSSKSILVTKVPVYVDVGTVTNKLTIHFQKRQVAGGEAEVENVLRVVNPNGDPGDPVYLVTFDSTKGVNAALRTHDDRVHKVNFGMKHKVQLRVTACPLELESKYLEKAGKLSTSNVQAGSRQGKEPSTETSFSTTCPSDANKQTKGPSFRSMSQIHNAEEDKMPPLAGMTPEQKTNIQHQSKGNPNDMQHQFSNPRSSYQRPADLQGGMISAAGFNAYPGGKSGLPSHCPSQQEQSGQPPPHLFPPGQARPPPQHPSQQEQSGPPPQHPSPPGQTRSPPQDPSQQEQSGPPPQYPCPLGQSGMPPNYAFPPGQAGLPPNYAYQTGQPGAPFSHGNPVGQYGPHSQHPYLHPMVYMQQILASLPAERQQEMMMMMMSQNFSTSMSTNHPGFDQRTETPTEPEGEPSAANPIASDDEDMVDLSDYDTNCMIEVSGCNSHTSLETIEMYFENERRSGGGDVSECRQEGDKFIVTFENQDAVKRVLEHPSHVVEGTTLTVRKARTDNKSEIKAAANDEDTCMVDLSDDDTNCMIEVSGCNSHTSLETIEMYFDNKRRSGGGDVSKCRQEGDKFIVTFENQDVMKQVLQRQHVIDNTPLTVKEPPKQRKPRLKQLPKNNKCLLLKGLEDNTSKENILLYLENRTRIEEDPQLLFGEEPGTVMVRYQEDISDSDFKKIDQRISDRTLNGARLVVKPMTLTDSVLVLNLPTNITKDTIELYFENNRKSGGGDVEEVKIDLERRVAVVYFEDYQVVNSVISRGHVINKVQLDVQPYHECLGFTVSSDGPTPNIPQPFPFKVNSDIITFIMNNNQEEFGHVMKQLYVQVEWPYQDKRDVVLLKPNLSQDMKNLHVITKTWMNDVKSALLKYLQRFIAVPISVMEGIWLQVFGQLKGLPQNKDVCMIMDQASSTILLTGKSDNVDKLRSRIESVIKDIEDEMQRAKERITEKVKVDNIQARQLFMCKFSKDIQDKYPDVIMKISPNTETVSLEGLPHDILKVRVLMYETWKDIPIIKMKPPSISLLQYLKMTEVSKRLYNQFSSAKIQAFYLVQNEEIVCSAVDKVSIGKAVEIIKNSIKELRIDIKPQSAAALQKKEWSTMVPELEERHTVQISCENNRVLIIGFETEANMVMSELQEFIQAHTIIEFVLEAENGKLRYIFEYKKDDVTKIQSESRIAPFNITPKYIGPVTGFLLKGTEDDVKTAQLKMKKLIDDIHGRPYPVDKPGMPKLFKEEKGKNYIKLVENEIKCKIDINDPSEEIDERADEEDMEEEFEELTAGPSPMFDILCHHTIRGRRRIVVGKGDLTTMHVDVVVNAANASLDHSSGGLTKAIADAGGPVILQECADILKKKGGRLHPGQVVCTSSGNMPCKIVIHAVGPQWTTGHYQGTSSHRYTPHGHSQEENMLADAVQNSLSTTEKMRFSSIAIPAISSAAMGFPLDVCTQTIVSAVDDWAENAPPGLLMEIRLMDNSDKTCESFKNAMMKHFGEDKVTLTADDTSTSSSTGHHHRRHGGTGNQSAWGGGDIGVHQMSSFPADEPQPGSHGIHATANPAEITTKEGKTICLVKGSISQQMVDVIVNTTQSSLNLNTGAVSKSILQAAGMRLQQEINSQKMSGVSTNAGDVVVTSGGNMQCTNIYHVLCCGWDHKGTKASQVLRKIMQTCLQTAAENGYSTIAFPAIGTGGLQFPRDVTARIMYEEVTSYSAKNPATSISKIFVVVYDQDFATIQAFEDEIGRLTGVPLKKRHGHGSGGSWSGSGGSRAGSGGSRAGTGGFTEVKRKKKKVPTATLR